MWWAHPDSNREPKDYESPAPPLSYRPVLHVDYCTRKLSSQGNFIYPYADRRHSHRLRDRVDQRGARGRRLEVAVLLLERGDALLDRGVGLHLCEKATRADGLDQLWSGRRDSNPHGRCPRAPEARASAVPPRPDGTWPRSRTQVSGFGDRRTAIVLARCV